MDIVRFFVKLLNVPKQFFPPELLLSKYKKRVFFRKFSVILIHNTKWTLYHKLLQPCNISTGTNIYVYIGRGIERDSQIWSPTLKTLPEDQEAMPVDGSQPRSPPTTWWTCWAWAAHFPPRLTAQKTSPKTAIAFSPAMECLCFVSTHQRT